MRQYKSLPIERLVSDVAVDPVHVRELADSIKVSGPISPVLVREDNLALIDGFHRVAAMKELGFNEVECILTPCDDETFWDLRIMSASLHKAVTFARAVDWVEEAFQASPFKQTYPSAYIVFDAVHKGRASKDCTDWSGQKAQKWGLSLSTIRQWLYTKQALAPDVYAEAKEGASGIPTSTFVRVGDRLSGRPELQRAVIEKAKAEDLTGTQVEQVASAVRNAPNEQEARAILRQPVSRTAQDLTRAAKVEKLLSEPTVEPTPREQQRKLAGLALEVYLDLQQQVHNVRRLTPEVLAALRPEQKEEMLQVVNELMAALHQLADSLGGVTKGAIVVEGKMLAGGNYGTGDQRLH